MEFKDKQLLVFERSFLSVLKKITYFKNLIFSSLISHFQLIKQPFFPLSFIFLV